jgi:hypothetical protein
MKSHLRRGDRLRFYPADEKAERWEVKSVGSEKIAVRRIDDGRAGAWDSWTHEWVVDQLSTGRMVRQGAGQGARL